MYYVLQIMDIIALVMMVFMLAVIITQQPSRAQLAFILYDVGTIVFVVGIHLELIHADTRSTFGALCPVSWAGSLPDGTFMVCIGICQAAHTKMDLYCAAHCKYHYIDWSIYCRASYIFL